MSTGFFGDLQPVRFEGPDSDNPLAYRHYDPDEVVLGKRLEDHLRFSVAYWHSFAWTGTDPFGGDTRLALAEHGIRGNGHMMMLEANNRDVADAIIGWVEGRTQ